MNYNIKYTVCVCVFLLFSAAARAQIATPASLEQVKMQSLWMNSTNSAGLLLDSPIKYSEINASYNITTGDFHRPQQGNKISNLVFDTEGGVLLNKTYVWGEFTYTRKAITDAVYNASIIDPYRGMPYIIADENSSNWNHQYFNLRFRATRSISSKLALGLEGTYDAMSGAKQRDIRTANYFFKLGLKPAIVYTINSKHTLGFNLDYFSIKEESENKLVNSQDYQPYYALYGVGKAIHALGSGRTTNYEGNGVGAALQYSYKGNVSLLLNSSYNLKVEEAVTSFTLPKQEGTVRDYTWDNKLQVYKLCDSKGHYLTLQYLKRSIDGIEYIKEFSNEEGVNQWVTLRKDVRSHYNTRSFLADYDFVIGNDKEYSWKVGAGLLYTNQKDEYVLPYSEKSYENMLYQLRAKKNFFLSERLAKRFLLGVDVCYNKNLSGKYSYNGTITNNVIVDVLEPADIRYLTASYYSAGLSATYSQKIKDEKKASLFARLDYKYTKANDFGFEKRQLFQLSLGCSF